MDGYGVFYLRGKNRLAHRVAYGAYHGELPPLLDHLCEMPPCVNPMHLEPVTNQENIRRALEKTHCLRGHVLTPENRIGKNRECRKCRKIHIKKWNDKRYSGPRGWQWGTRSCCSRGHPYTVENTYVFPDGRRQCRQCKGIYQRKYLAGRV